MPQRIEITDELILLSVATDKAVRAVGGKIAEYATGLSDTQLGRAAQTANVAMLRIEQAVAIDRAGLARGGPHILNAMADMLGFLPIPMPTAPCDHAEIGNQILVVAQELGDVSREAMAAQTDGHWTPREAKRVIAQVDELIGGAAALRGLLYAIAWPAGMEAGA